VSAVSSNPTILATGVPQRSVLGPVLLSADISPVSSLIATHSLQYASDMYHYSFLYPLSIPHTPTPGLNLVPLTSTLTQ